MTTLKDETRPVATKIFEAADIAEWRAGWRIVAGSAVGLGTGVSLYLIVSSLFIKGITGEFGWSRGDMSVAGAVAFVVGALSLSIVGKLIDRFGFRPVVMVCVPGMAALYLLIASQPGPFAFYLALMVWGGAFGAGTGAIAYTRPIIGAFAHQRGLALGLATSGVSLMSIAVAPLLGQVIGDHGWRAGFYTMSALTVGVGLPAALVLIGRPRADQNIAARAIDEVRDAAALVLAVPDVTIGAALRSLRFWLLVVALVAVNIPGSGVVGQLAPLIGDRGFSEVATGYVMSIYAVGLLAGRLITGFALDRLPPATVAAVMTLVPAIGMALLLIPAPSFALAAFAVAMIGIQQGSEVDLLAYFISRNFGVRWYGAIYGRVATFGAIGTAVGLLLFGKTFDATGNYDAALMIGAVSFVMGATAFFCVRTAGATAPP